ncbi:M20/M25/M40 family metallo-hydrolase [Salinifilum ghardaiensis]
MRDVARAAEDALPEVLADVRRLVERETPSHDRDALERGLAEHEALLVERLGRPEARTLYDGGRRGDVLDVTFPGTAPGRVLLLCHYDTVWPVGTLAEWPFRVDGDRATGPGCLDMKIGTVHGVRALVLLRELGIPHPSVRFLLTGDEEIGSDASREHIERACAAADGTLVLEPGRAGTVKTHRKGLGMFEVTTRGVEAHAGLDPTAGASAVHALAELVPRIAALAAPEAGTTVNIGRIEGGTGRNVVAGRATCEIDVRIQDPDERARIDAGLAALHAADPRVEVRVTGGWNRPPMNPNPPSQELFATAGEVAAELGQPLEGVAVGGVSDANFVSALGRPVLDGLGGAGAGPHSRDEHFDPGRSPGRIALLAGILARLGATSGR